MQLATLVVAALVLAPCVALDKPKQFLSKLDLDGSKLKDKFETLTETLGLRDGGAVVDDTSQCPVCDGDEDIGAVKKALTKLTQGAGKKTLLRANRNKLKKQVSIDTVVTTLTAAESHFAAVAQSSRDLIVETKFTTVDGSPVAVDLLTVLEGVSSFSANLMGQISNSVGAKDTRTVGLVVGVINSILSLIQGIILSILSIFTGFLNAIAGVVSISSFDRSSVQVTSVLDALLSTTPGGIFADVVQVLEAEKDTSGLAGILTNSTANLTVVGDQLSTFLSSTDAALATTSSSSTAVQGNTINEILALITGLISTILSLIVQIITTIINLIVSIIRSVISLIVGIIQAIINLIVSILNSILGIFSSSSSTKVLGSDTVDENSPSLDGFILLIFQSLLCVAGNNCLRSKKATCQKEALECQNNALSTAIPSV